jgi:hypothetical protein
MKIKSFCWFSNLIFGNSLAFFIEKLGCYSAHVGGMTPGMAKSSRLRARITSRIKKRCYYAKDMKKRRKQKKNRALGRLPAPAACSGCAWAGFRLACLGHRRLAS